MPTHAYAHVLGHLGQDPEMKSLHDGTSVCSFTLATTRKRRDQDITTWWRCSLFGPRGEAFAKYLHKGDPVLVYGEPYVRPWQDQSGAQRQTLEMRCDGFAFVGRMGGGDQNSTASIDGDVPF